MTENHGNNMLSHLTMGGPDSPEIDGDPVTVHIPPPQPVPAVELEYGNEMSEVEGDMDDHVVLNANTAGPPEHVQLPASVSMATTVSGISMDDVIEFMNTPQPKEPSHDDDVELIEVEEEGESSQSAALLNSNVASPKGDDHLLPDGCGQDVDLIDTDYV